MAGEVGSYESGNNQKHAVKAKLHIDTDEWQSSCFCAVLMNAYIYAYIYTNKCIARIGQSERKTGVYSLALWREVCAYI